MTGTSAGRVPAHTTLDVNLEIQERLRLSLAYYTDHPTEIPDRLADLDREWDIERALAAGSSSLTLTGLLLGLSGRRRWFVLPLVVQAFYVQHTLQGWCPPLPLLRRLAFRTPNEIERERAALKEILRDQRPGGDPKKPAPEQERDDEESDKPTLLH